VTGLLLVVLGAARAGEEDFARSIDTQLVHPALAAEAGFAVESPRAGAPDRVTLGAAWQWERQPLLAYFDGAPAGAPIETRQSLELGVAWAASRRSALSLRLSGALMEPGEPAALAPERALALGDLALGVRSAWLLRERVALGPALRLWLPVGSDESWVAERGLRYEPALLLSAGGERVEALASLGALARVEVDSGADFVAAPELLTGLSLRLGATPWLAGLAELGSRHGFSGFLAPGAENPAWILGGLRLSRSGWGRLDLLGGTGLSQGYGASELRFAVALVSDLPARAERPQPAPPPAAVAPAHAAAEVPAVPAPAVVEQPRAWVEAGHLRLDHALAFEPGSARMLPESEPSLARIAALLRAYPQLELVVVEGHADDLGDAARDFALSTERARIVFERLVAASVRPARLSWRGLGAVDPGGPAGARGVDFAVARVRPLQEGLPPWDDSPITLPWSGELLPAPPAGTLLLASDGVPLAPEAPVPAAADPLPSGGSFREALDEEDEP